MRQYNPPVIGVGSRPKRALTIRATCPGGTIGTVDAGGAAGAGACAGGGGRAAGCAGGGPRISGLEGAWGASTPDPPPDGARLGGPIEPGGRGMLSKPGGVCASAADTSRPHAIMAAINWRPRDRTAAPEIINPVYCRKSGEFKPLAVVCHRSGPMLGAAGSAIGILHEI